MVLSNGTKDGALGGTLIGTGGGGGGGGGTEEVGNETFIFNETCSDVCKFSPFNFDDWGRDRIGNGGWVISDIDFVSDIELIDTFEVWSVLPIIELFTLVWTDGFRLGSGGFTELVLSIFCLFETLVSRLIGNGGA